MIQNDNPDDGRCWVSFPGQTEGPQQPALQPGSQLQRKMALEAVGMVHFLDEVVERLGWDVRNIFIWVVLETVFVFIDFWGFR